jgi:hypothetical protein
MSIAASNNLTTTGAQAVTGAKTFSHQKLLLRNPADTASMTLQNPVFTGAKDMYLDEDADFIVFKDLNDSQIKALAGDTHAKEFTHASDLGSVLNSIHGSVSSNGARVNIKPGSYGWNTKLTVTKQHFSINGNVGTVITPNTGYASDMIAVDKDRFSITDTYWDCSNMSNGTGSWLNIGSGGVASDSPFVFHNRCKNVPTSGIIVGSSCNGLWAFNNTIQSFFSPSGHGIVLSNNADHEVSFNHIGGYGNATGGYGIACSGAGNSIISGNEIFTNRVGINLYLPEGMLVYGNLIQANLQHGIVIKNDLTGPTEKSIISFNRIHDNGSSSPNTYSGILIALSSTGGLNDVSIIGNTMNDSNPVLASKNQKYAIDFSGTPTLLTNSVIAFNACGGNRTGAINRASLPGATCEIFGNTADTTRYSFQDFQEDRIVTAPSDPVAGFVRRYPKTIDANNDGLFYKTKVNGAVVEVAM